MTQSQPHPQTLPNLFLMDPFTRLQFCHPALNKGSHSSGTPALTASQDLTAQALLPSLRLSQVEPHDELSFHSLMIGSQPKLLIGSQPNILPFFSRFSFLTSFSIFSILPFVALILGAISEITAQGFPQGCQLLRAQMA